MVHNYMSPWCRSCVRLGTVNGSTKSGAYSLHQPFFYLRARFVLTRWAFGGYRSSWREIIRRWIFLGGGNGTSDGGFDLAPRSFFFMAACILARRDLVMR